MAHSNHYETLQVSSKATQSEIKQAYRRLVKLFHPDSNSETAGHEEIVRLNAAYEILGDTQRRQSYDRQMHKHSTTAPSSRQGRTASTQTQSRQRQTGHDTDEQLQQWLTQVYKPVNQMLARILNPLTAQIDKLSADPFDDELLEAFQTYLNTCREFLNQAQQCFRSMPNPAPVAGVAAHLYYCLNQVGDGIDELEFFTLNYDDYYLHTGQELFRIAAGLRREAQVAIRDI
ncbi:J domain-containing protein [Microcoleus sp. FACHB-672]|uniref:J domain-containing protein n=1 Tax=Microcoleus sp. FACHB-672 TaxID=2692825 RepID=UPI001681EDFA|nr:J domain-containing protein [Microcoleus sp. FACHB-672]MBD2042478.1 DnaJ domain-containing protein [Microcoleus sp. FACHB-672]